MRNGEIERVAAALGSRVLAASTLAGGFSHETCLLTLPAGRVVVRLGGPDPAVEAAVMAAGRRHVPVPEVLLVLPGGPDARPAMVLEHVAGTPLSEVLAGDLDTFAAAELGAELGRVTARIGAVVLDRPGFFSDERLTVPAGGQGPDLPGFAADCMARTPDRRLTEPARAAWVRLCAAHAPALAGIGGPARLVHADLNPKNILVSRGPGGWRVDAVLDWEFSYAGSPYADGANMTRFGDGPAAFRAAFLGAFGDGRPADWAYLGRVLDMFSLSDLVTRPVGHPVADQAAAVITGWLGEGVPRL